MRKLFILTWVILLAVIQSYAQTAKAELVLGTEYKDAKLARIQDIVTSDDTGTYLVKSTDRHKMSGLDVTLEYYNRKMEPVKAIDLKKIKRDGKKVNFEFVIYSDDKLYLFTSFKNQKLKKYFLFTQTIEKKTLKLNNDIKKVAEISYAGYSRYNAGDFHYRISRDDSKILIYYNLPYNKAGNEKYGFHVLNQDMSLVWERPVTLTYKEDLFEVNNVSVDNFGNTYLLGKLSDEKKGKKHEVDYEYQLITYLNNGKDVSNYSIRLKDKFLKDVNFRVNDNKDIVCAGFYSAKKIYNAVEGFYYTLIDGKTRQVKHTKSVSFTLDLMAQTLTEKEEKSLRKKHAKGGDVGLKYYVLDNIIFKEGGGVVLVGEQSYREKFTQGSTTYYKSIYGSLILIDLTEEGEVNWSQKIRKHNATPYKDGTIHVSYFMPIVNDKLYFIFNDNIENKDKKLSERGKWYGFTGTRGDDSYLAMVEVDNLGDMKKESLFISTKKEVLFRPLESKQLSSHKAILIGQRKGQHRFAELNFKDNWKKKTEVE